jgi:DNA repair exonuclease SbcCD ATPase subunit
MKEIIILRLTLLNFKGIRSLTVDFDEHETNIYGANAAGKTTVFDAFRWVLFGKDCNDRKDFNIKTIGADGKPIERLPHEVTADLVVDGEQITLKKCYVEKWTKKRGSAVETFSGHAVECYYNDVPCSVKEYEAKVSEICDEQVFKLITNPLFFTSQKKDFQRGMLINLAGDVTNQELVDENPEFSELVGMLSGKTVEELKREVASKKRKIKDGIDNIPARIDERKRDMPEVLDWSAIETNIKVHEYEITQLDAQIADRSKAFNEITKHKQEVAKQLSEVKSSITARQFELKDKLLADYNESRRSHDTAVQRATTLCNERRVKGLALPRLEKELASLKEKREGLIAEWRNIKAMTFAEPDRNEFVCPTCKRPLEADDVDAKIEELRTAFNADKSKRLESNKTLGIETKNAIEAKEAEIKAINDGCFKLDNEIAEIENSASYKTEPTEPNIEPMIEADSTLQELKAKVANLQTELDKEVSAPDTSDLQELKSKHQEAINADKVKLHNRETIANSNKRIKELEDEYKTSQDELARLEGIEFTIQQFCKARIEHVESRINGMFKLVRFKMYEQQINGGEIETCEATVNGVPFSDLNNAMKINAGLDIINAICAANGIIAPIFIDNRESVSDIVSTQSQIVNLIVDANCKTLKII